MYAWMQMCWWHGIHECTHECRCVSSLFYRALLQKRPVILRSLHECTHECMTWYTRMYAWLIHMCDMTHSYVWHDSFTCVTWLIHMCDMTHSCVWHDSFTCVTWLIHMCDMTHSHVWHHLCDMTHSHVCHNIATSLIHTCVQERVTVQDTGWQRPIGCFKSQVNFRKRAINYSPLLRNLTHNGPLCIYAFGELQGLTMVDFCSF